MEMHRSSARRERIVSGPPLFSFWILVVGAIRMFSAALDAPGTVTAYGPLPSRFGIAGQNPRRSASFALLRASNNHNHNHSHNHEQNGNAVNMDNGMSSRKRWTSLLPLPEHAPDEGTASRSRAAMEGPDPPALAGRVDVDLAFGGGDRAVRWLHVDPPVLVVDDFLTPGECENVLALTGDRLPPDAGRVIKIQSQVGGSSASGARGSGHDSGPSSNSNSSNSSGKKRNLSQRHSTTWYVRYGCGALAPLFHNLEGLLPALDRNRIEEVQLVRYAGDSQGFAWHEDSLDEATATPEAGGQRVATVLVYLDDVVVRDSESDENRNSDSKIKSKTEGNGGESSSSQSSGSGRTLFRDLLGPNGEPLAVDPKRGRALLFFPAIQGETALGTATDRTAFGPAHAWDNTRSDRRTVHAGEPPGIHRRGRGVAGAGAGSTNNANANANGTFHDGSVNVNVNDGGATGSDRSLATKHIAQLWIHSAPHTPVVFGRGVNRHGDAQKHIDELRARLEQSVG